MSEGNFGISCISPYAIRTTIIGGVTYPAMYPFGIMDAVGDAELNFNPSVDDKYGGSSGSSGFCCYTVGPKIQNQTEIPTKLFIRAVWRGKSNGDPRRA